MKKSFNYAEIIIVEALLGKIYSCVNATGDIAAMVIAVKNTHENINFS